MNPIDEGRVLKTEILRTRRGTQGRYALDLRMRILGWLERAMASGLTRQRCAELLGFAHVRQLPRATGSPPSVALEPVPVVLAMPAEPVSVEPSRGVLMTASGYRVEGLSLAQIATLLRELA